MKSIFDDNNYMEINPRVLHALLNIDKYYHGTRSIEALIDMSVASYRDYTSFEPAMIPPLEQLNIHVNGKKFIKLMNEARFPKK